MMRLASISAKARFDIDCDVRSAEECDREHRRNLSV
jgi:hypothetical protein